MKHHSPAPLTRTSDPHLSPAPLTHTSHPGACRILQASRRPPHGSTTVSLDSHFLWTSQLLLLISQGLLCLKLFAFCLFHGISSRTSFQPCVACMQHAALCCLDIKTSSACMEFSNKPSCLSISQRQLLYHLLHAGSRLPA